MPVYLPSASDSGRPLGPVFEDPSDTLSLRDAVALVLLHSPDLAAFAWEARAREARVLQAGRLPNPVIGVMSEDFGATSRSSGGSASQAVQPQTTLQLSQLVELAGKRTARRGLAARDRDLAAWDYESARMDVLTRVTHAFIDVLFAQEMVGLTRQSAQLVREVQEGVVARVAAGMVSPLEATKADVAVAAADVESRRAQRLLDASRSRLAAHWGKSEATFPAAAGDLSDVNDLPPIAELRTRLVQNPELARWAVELSQREAALAVERAKRVPDVTLTAGYRRFGNVDIDAYVVGVALPLPLFDRNGGGTAEAVNRVRKAYEERRAAEARVSAALASTYNALASAHQELTALRETVLPRSEQIFAATNEGYRLGRFAYLDVLEAQRTLIGARGQYLRAVSDHHKAVADLERLIGAPLAEIPQ
ncbi:MAG: TolC family protein [Gemmatimonadaceae bacterium]